jgi:NADPH:quinone reductase-like Zn-dependent oxidoreductase
VTRPRARRDFLDGLEVGVAVRARKLGASDLINYRDTPDWHLAVQEITQGEGATHILEAGQDTYERSLQCVAPNGTIAQIGVLAGFDLRPNLLPLSRLNANIVGIQTGSRQYFEDMNRFIDEHESEFSLRPGISDIDC